MQSTVNDFTVFFIGILLEALPFVLLGSLLSSAIALFVSDTLILRLIPRSYIGGLAVASILGLVFPVCDCTIIPVMRRLIVKGLPVSMAVTFMCAVPIVNPAVIVSTSWAFSNISTLVWMRFFVGIWTAIAAGFIMGKMTRERSPLLDTAKSAGTSQSHEHHCSCEHHTDTSGKEYIGCDCAENHDHSEHAHDCMCKNKTLWQRLLQKWTTFIKHTLDEFVESGSLIIIGAALSASIQMVVPRTLMYPFSSDTCGSVGIMMAFSWLISLCSNADAFVAKSFYGLFTTGSVLVFMTFGQMIDLKNTVVLAGYFKKRFVVALLAVLTILNFFWGVLINIAGKGL